MLNWQSELVKGIENIIWSQWAAMGAYISAAPCTRVQVDPEALLVATCAFGRYDARIFDEALDWTIKNHGLLNAWRLKRIMRGFGAGTVRTLGAFLEYSGSAARTDVLSGVRKEARKSLGKVQEEPLFWNESRLYRSGSKARDETFERWKLLRGKPRIRGHSGMPKTDLASNLVISLRHLMGGAKADVMAYLLTDNSGSSRSIAAKVWYNQTSARDALEELLVAGVVEKEGGQGNARYWIAGPRAVARGYNIMRVPVFFDWTSIFQGFHKVAEDMRENADQYRSDFFVAERMRKLTIEVVPMIRKAAGPLDQIRLPRPGGLEGKEHAEELMGFLSRAINIMSSFCS